MTRWEATQRVMVAKLTRLTHKIAIQLHLVADSCTTCSSRCRRPVRKLLVTPSYFFSKVTFSTEDFNKVHAGRLTRRHGMKTYGSWGIAPRVLTSSLCGGKWLASHPGRFTARNRAPVIHWIGCWVDPRVDLVVVAKKKKYPLPRRETNSSRPVHSLIAILTQLVSSIFTRRT
jgi:hypothetical protein